MREEIAVKVENVSKTFRLPHEKHTSLKGAFLNSFKQKSYEVQEALKDVSFEVKKGEFFGIVGRNGSGKSTLLKCMAGVYSPTKGKLHIEGSLVPFIELGVGFNPELSGRDNVYLNGALLGFSRKQMNNMYDDIVEFAELEQFMDQKLKNYSSGMQVRLAFSIAIRAKGDILLLDEVLAVGDENFQRKCNDYFEELKKDNKTVILVTHSMAAVERYCTRAMILDKGQIKRIGMPTTIANQYSLDNLNDKPGGKSEENKNKSLSNLVKKIEIKPISKQSLTNTDNFEFEITYELSQDLEVDLGIALIQDGRSVIEHNTKEINGLGSKKDTTYRIRYRMPLKHLTPKQYGINVAIFEKKDFKLIGFNSNSCKFMITAKDGPRGGVLNTRGEWIITRETT